jgi:hypothetical protein
LGPDALPHTDHADEGQPIGVQPVPVILGDEAIQVFMARLAAWLVDVAMNGQGEA